MASKNSDSRKTGETIIVGGLFIQIIFFGVFVLAAALFHFRMRQVPTPRSLEVPWQKHMMALYLTSLLILVRSIFRVIEFLQGFEGYILQHEAFLYIFDASLMLIAMLIMNWIHPSEIRGLLHGGKSSVGLRMVNISV
jgi:hypothetical protein